MSLFHSLNESGSWVIFTFTCDKEPYSDLKWYVWQSMCLLEPHMERKCYNKDSCVGVSIIQQPFCPVSNNHHFSQQFDFLPYGDLYIVIMATLNLGIVNPAAWCPVHNIYQRVDPRSQYIGTQQKLFFMVLTGLFSYVSIIWYFSLGAKIPILSEWKPHLWPPVTIFCVTNCQIFILCVQIFKIWLDRAVPLCLKNDIFFWGVKRPILSEWEPLM